VDLLDKIPMEDRDTKGDLYEYMLGKIASAGQNGQFRTPRHIIRLMVEMTKPTPQDVICDPAAGTRGCCAIFVPKSAFTCAARTGPCPRLPTSRASRRPQDMGATVP
jgi:hypothetical protein